ncbi:MAG: hypothetical protein EOP51_24150 [Sphingobacteriales bacterium]|nr:MAG: hypothetical protein EOP51_24150 [Sphingobacteriales bacterium]
MKKFTLYLIAGVLLVSQSCKKSDLNKGAGQDAVSLVSSPAGSNLKVNATTLYSTFRFISANGGLSSQVSGQSLADGGVFTVAAYQGTAHQQWRVTDVGNGYFTLMSNGSGKLATSYFYSGAQQLIQGSPDTANPDSQLWSLISVGNAKYKAINKASGLAITSTGAGRLMLLPYADNSTQWWGFNQLPDLTYRDDAVVNFFHRPKVTETTVAFDQGNSIPLSNGKVLWITQDAWDAVQLQNNNAFACNGVSPYHNSALLQPSITNWDPLATPNVTTTHSPGQPLQILATRPGLSWSWPGAGFELDGHVYLLCTEGGGGGNYFSTSDQVMYDLTMADGTNWATAPVRKTIAGLSGQDMNEAYITWTVGMADPKDGFVYVYGYYNYKPGTNPFISHNSEVYVARFPKTAEGVTNWTFWNGTSFVANLPVSEMKKIGSGKEGLSNVTVSYVNGKYVLLDMDYGFSCDPKKHTIALATASSPTGPFTSFTTVYDIPDRFQGHVAQYYTPLIHPEFVNGKNELLITYCLNFYTACASTCTDGLDATYYQIKGIRVPYSMVGIPNQ